MILLPVANMLLNDCNTTASSNNVERFSVALINSLHEDNVDPYRKTKKDVVPLLINNNVIEINRDSFLCFRYLFLMNK